MRWFVVVFAAVALQACGTVKGTATGFVNGLGQDVSSVGNSLQKVGK
jgi:predicted small secreted protein